MTISEEVAKSVIEAEGLIQRYELLAQEDINGDGVIGPRAMARGVVSGQALPASVIGMKVGRIRTLAEIADGATIRGWLLEEMTQPDPRTEVVDLLRQAVGL